MTDETLRELATQLPADRPSAERAERVRASLLAAATLPATPAPRRWALVGAGFAVGAVAAAAVVLLVARGPSEPTAASPHAAYARIESSSAAAVEHTLATAPGGGSDEVVRVRAGTLRLAVPAPRIGDRVRVTTADAEIEGAGEYEIEVAHDSLARVTVSAGSATLRIAGRHEAVFLAAGQTWRAAVQTADLLAPATAPGGALEPVEPSPDPAAAGDVPAVLPVASVPKAATSGAQIGTSIRTETSTGAPIENSIENSGETSGEPASKRSRGTSTVSSTRASTTSIGTSIDAPRVAASPRLAGRPAGDAPTPAAGPIEDAPPAGTGSATPAQLTTGAAVAPAQVASPASEIERRFRAGTALLRANKLAEAVEELGAAADAGDTPLAADARYFQAVALVKAKRGAEAERALVRFLDAAPASIRRGRAAMMLGRLLADRGDARTARDWFTVAANDPDPTVAAAAKAALAAR